MPTEDIRKRLREVEKELGEIAEEINAAPPAPLPEEDDSTFEIDDDPEKIKGAKGALDHRLLNGQGRFIPHDPNFPDRKSPEIPLHTPLLRLLYNYHHGVCIPEYLNGWCCMVWVIQTAKAKGGDSRVDSAKNTRLISKAPPAVVNDIAAKMMGANRILFQSGNGIGLRICEVNVLDARRIYWLPRGKKTTLAGKFVSGKAQMIQGQDSILEEVENICTNGFAERETVGGSLRTARQVMTELRAKLRKPCVHLFIVEDVEDPKKPDKPPHNTAGFGGRASFGATNRGNPAISPVAAIEGSAQATTFAHEIGHALGLPHSDDKSAQARRVNDAATLADKKNLMLPANGNGSLQPTQLRAMLNFLIANVAPACP
ncbi:MAG: zinc-dependent metalloprotease family protein [Gallionellaceae bacterium]